MAKAAFGVDFGTTNTSVAYSGARGETRCNTFPSILNVLTKKIGTLHDSPETSVMRMKRAVGYTHSRAKKQGVLVHLHYDAIGADNDGGIVFKVNEEPMPLSRCIATFLRIAIDETRAMAGDFYKDCNRCSITYPAGFHTIDIDAIKNAFADAKLEVISSVSEPIAAAVHELTADDSSMHLKDGELVFTLDVGGTTFDLAVMQKNPGFGDMRESFTVLKSGGDSRLGGSDIDADIVKLFKEKAETLSEADQSWIQDAQNDAALLCIAEDVKKELSAIPSTVVKLGDSFVEVTREDLDKACSATFDKMRKTCKEFLESNNFKREDIAAASLIGGGTQSPQIKAFVHIELFPHLPLTQIMDKDFDTAVAQGALKIVLTGKSQVMELTDCTQMEYGIRMVHFGKKLDERFRAITFGIKAGQSLPMDDAEIDALVPTTPHRNIQFPIYECKNIKADDNPESDANSFYGELIIPNDNYKYKQGSPVKILLSISPSRQINVKVRMDNGDLHDGVLKKRGDREFVDKLTEQNAVTDFRANGNTQLSCMAEPSQPDRSISPTDSLAEPPQSGGSLPPTEPQEMSDDEVTPPRPKKRQLTRELKSLKSN